MPAISVIIPAYNSQNTILSTIESVQKQSFSNLEILVIDDGSQDETVEVVNSIEDERIKVKSFQNGGVSLARNRGISLAKGEYIAFMDADDLWTSDKLELQLTALEKHPEAALAYSWTYIMSEDGEKVHKCHPIYHQGDVYKELLIYNFLLSPGSNILVRKAAIDSTGDFDTSLSHYEDWDFCLRLAINWYFVVVPKYQVFYRQSSNSASSNIEAFEKSVLTVIERSFQYAPKEIQYLKSKSIASSHLYWTQLYLTRVAGFAGVNQARKHLFKAISLYPKILLNKKAQIFLLKIVLMYFLTPGLASNLLRFISEKRSTKLQNINYVGTRNELGVGS